jgi:hypothetical protein
MEQVWEWIKNRFCLFCAALFIIVGEITLFHVLYTQDHPSTAVCQQQNSA